MTIQEVADSLGVHYMTAYRYVRQGRLPATRLGTEWRIRPSDVAALRVTGRRGTARTSADREALERQMVIGDSARGWWLLQSHLAGGLDPSGVLIELVVPALRSIGERWASGEVSVAEEHRATAVAQRVVGHLGMQFGRRGKDRERSPSPRHRGTCTYFPWRSSPIFCAGGDSTWLSWVETRRRTPWAKRWRRRTGYWRSASSRRSAVSRAKWPFRRARYAPRYQGFPSSSAVVPFRRPTHMTWAPIFGLVPVRTRQWRR